MNPFVFGKPGSTVRSWVTDELNLLASTVNREKVSYGTLPVTHKNAYG
jgi:hypothetical protein